jgi:hypothetical protein
MRTGSPPEWEESILREDTSKTVPRQAEPSVKVDTIRSMTRLPFHPFSIRTASGHSYHVAHPELLWLDPVGEVLLVKDAGAVVLIDLEEITVCVRAPKARNSSTDN